MPALTRRELLQLPFGLLVKERQEAQEYQIPEEIVRLVNIVSIHSRLRDQSLMGLINEIFRVLELPEADLGDYGTVYRREE